MNETTDKGKAFARQSRLVHANRNKKGVKRVVVCIKYKSNQQQVFCKGVTLYPPYSQSALSELGEIYGITYYKYTTLLLDYTNERRQAVSAKKAQYVAFLIKIVFR